MAADWLLEGREHAEMERAGVLDERTSGVGGRENGCRKVAETMSCAHERVHHGSQCEPAREGHARCHDPLNPTNNR